MRNTFNTKNTYENILTGINKEEIFTTASSDSGSAAQLSAGGENVTAFAGADHCREMFLN
jgi:hypothetical protein